MSMLERPSNLPPGVTENDLPGNEDSPEPTMEEPSIEELMEWEKGGYCLATDGCKVEPDGVCPHGHNSWLLELGMI